MSRIHDGSEKAEKERTTSTETWGPTGRAHLDQPAAVPFDESSVILVEARAEEHQKRLAELSTSAIEELQHKSDAFLEGFQGQLQKTLQGFAEKGAKKTTDQLQKLAEGLLERSAKQLQKQADDTVKKSSEELKTSGTGLVQETKQQLVGMTQASRNIWAGIQRKSETLLEGFQGKLQNILNGFEHRGVKEVADRLQKIAEESLERSAKQLQKRVDDAVEKLSEELRASGTRLVQETQQQLASITQASLEFFTKETKATAEEWRSQIAQTLQEQVQSTYRSPDAVVNSINVAVEGAVAQLRAVGQKIELSFETKAEDHQKRLAVRCTSAIEELQRKSDVLLEGFQSQLQNDQRGFHENGVKEVTDHLQKIGEESLERSAKQLQKQADDTGEKVSEELNASGARLVQETEQQLASITQTFLEALTQETKASAEKWRSQLAQTFQEHVQGASRNADAALNSIQLAAGDTMAKLQAAGQKIEVGFETQARDHQKRLAELSTSAIKELEGSSDALLEGFQGHLQNALHGFEQKGAKKVADQLQKITESLLEGSATQLQNNDDTMEMLSEELKASGTRLVQETQQQFAGITQGYLDSLSRQTTATAQECQSLEHKREAIQQQIEDFGRASLEKLRLDYARLQDGPSQRVTGLRLGLKVALWLFAIVSSPLFIYLSTRPVMRLRYEPPAEFFDERNLDAPQRATEDVLAQAYWDSAVRSVQWKYAFGTNLPDEPPPEFRVDEKSLQSRDLKIEPGARARYWQRLRQVWGLPQAWDESFTWNMGWLRGTSGSHQKTRK